MCFHKTDNSECITNGQLKESTLKSPYLWIFNAIFIRSNWFYFILSFSSTKHDINYSFHIHGSSSINFQWKCALFFYLNNGTMSWYLFIWNIDKNSFVQAFLVLANLWLHWREVSMANTQKHIDDWVLLKPLLPFMFLFWPYWAFHHLFARPSFTKINDNWVAQSTF